MAALSSERPLAGRGWARGAAPPGALMFYRPSYQHRRSRRVVRRRIVAVVVLVVVAVVVAGAIQLLRGTPRASATVVLPARIQVSGTMPKLPWPKHGAAAVEVVGAGGLGGVDATQELPLASITKLVTALVVLDAHPLTVGQPGPAITVTAADAAAYAADLAANDSVLAVRSGEHLSELQALEGLLIPSGDNVADILADWVSGSQGAFVARMNAEARALGLHHTHLDDAAGLATGSAGSASDMVRLGADVLASPVLRRIVAMPQVTLPVAGTVTNYDAALGQDGIVGIKTGSTTEAGGNFLFAARRKVDGRAATVVGAVLGQALPLSGALAVGKRLATAAFHALRVRTILRAGAAALRVDAPWQHAVTGKTARAVTALCLPGETVSARVTEGPALRHGRNSMQAGARVATVVLRAGGRAYSDPVVASGRLSPPSFTYRLGHG